MPIATKGVYRRHPKKESPQVDGRLGRYAHIMGFAFFFVVMAPADTVSEWLEELAPGSLWALRYALIALTIILYAMKGEKAVFYGLALAYGGCSILTMIFGDAPLIWAVRVAFPCVSTMLLVGVYAQRKSDELLWGMLVVMASYSVANTIELVYTMVAHPDAFGQVAYTSIGYRNGFSRIYLPSIIVSVLLDARRGKRFSLRSLLLLLAALVQSYLAFSATSAVELAFVIVGLALIQKRDIRRVMNAVVFGVGYLVFFLLLVVFRAQSVFGLFIERVLHRGLDFTGRTELWDQTFAAVYPDYLLFGRPKGGSPLLGFGSETFWTAHNGILDILLWGGLLSLMVCLAMTAITCIGLYKRRLEYSASLYSLLLGAFFVGGLMESVMFIQFVFFLAMAYAYTKGKESGFTIGATNRGSLVDEIV
ncbi:hypothetical protein VJ923_09620 [Adlercreutzia sp. R25]|uniref:hypothetical protein n=1 Tax=Adlercreutzia shanghongiae TaxID=3111773 RepID=UPI002DBE034C|nr:hypothetical protein [Adlercreutzia sp. R25]MEC4273413.1 hypothetical protein [Adlercreutzia sp. R25]